ncbi:glycosyltransferase [Brevibacterium sp. GP-SGM9]|uniref:glycosyltransferase n=1 Tax=Brevibacterium sp. GP-SGM9 TaxID=3376990 RepID=UPI0039A5F287
MFDRRAVLPDATIYGLIGGIPEEFGGRTSVCLQRANAFAELDRRTIEILTLSPKNGEDPEALTERLRSEGRIGKRVTIRNLWADLRRADTDDLNQIARYSGESITLDTAQLPEYAGTPEIITKNSAGKTASADRFRGDGTRFYSYRTAREQSPKSAVLHDTRGRPIAQWKEQYEFYFAWLDWLIGSEIAVIINDGPPLARYLHRYQRENVAIIQTIHSKHSADPTKRSERLGWTYTPALSNVDRFDRLAVLTESQRADLVNLNFVKDNASVLPNMTTAEPVRSVGARPPGDGVMLARTTFLKRIDHAITAVHLAQQNGVQATLDVYGVPDEAQESLEALVDELGSAGTIALRGFDPRAKKRFEEASFTLLTSRYEGQPLVLLESMAAGCIPIAYDIKYGPADIITHGINGFLVSDGDVDEMARCIAQLQSMDASRLRQMREAAVERTRAFSPQRITGLWSDVISQVLDDKRPPHDIGGRASLSTLSVEGGEFQVTVRITGEAACQPQWSLLTWTERHGQRFGRLPAEVDQFEGEIVVSAGAHIDDFAAVDRGYIDFWIDLRVAGLPCRLRIKDAENLTPVEFGHVDLYSTKFGSLSIRYEKPDQTG